jgi:hypothetical protein
MIQAFNAAGLQILSTGETGFNFALFERVRAINALLKPGFYRQLFGYLSHKERFEIPTEKRYRLGVQFTDSGLSGWPYFPLLLTLLIL